MQKGNRKTRKRSSENAAMVRQAAHLAGVSVSTGYMVLRMERKNERFLTAYMMLNEGQNKLMQEVKRILPEIA